MYAIDHIPQFTDKRGETVKVGDEVAYLYHVNGQALAAALGVGKVETIELHKGPYSWQQGLRVKIRSNYDGQLDEARNGYNIVKVVK